MKTVKLKDISINNRGYYGIGASAVDYDENKFTYLRITDINDDGSLNKNGLMSVDDEKSDQYLLEKNDIVFARTGASTGRNYFYDGEINNMVYAGFLIKFSLNPELVNPKFIKYYCLSKKYSDWISSSLTGSTRPNINEKQLSEMPIELPDRFYQDKVVGILDSISQKIQLNSETNNNLYEISKRLLLKYLDENKSSDEINISKFINIFTGKKNANETSTTGKYKFFSCAPESLLSDTYLCDSAAIIVAGNGAYTGRTRFYDGKFELYQRTYGLTLKDGFEKNNIYGLYVFMKTIFEPDKMGGTHGSAIPYIVLSDLTDYKLKYNKVEFDRFSNLVSGNIKLIQENEKSNEKLSQLRDTLLPKLLNGEIDLGNIEI